MPGFHLYTVLVTLLSILLAVEAWPYERFHGRILESGAVAANKARPEYKREAKSSFLDWLRLVVRTDMTGRLEEIFTNGTLPHDINQFIDLTKHIRLPDTNELINDTPLEFLIPNDPRLEAERVFQNLGFHLDPRCTGDRSKWWYRTYDGCKCSILSAG